MVFRHQEDSTTLSELRQVETLLDSLESKLGQFKQLFPKVELKRSLLNLGGTVLRTLFGTATMTDLHRLNKALGELQDRNAEVAHSLSKQVTFIRNLNTVANLNTEALVNLSSIVKDNVVKSYAKFQESFRDITWLYDTLRHHSEMYVQVRQLEYSLIMAVQQIGELFSSVQYALLGKLPVNLITPVTLHRILTDASLNLPENYELVAGTKIQDFHTYYELIKVALVGNAQGAQLVIRVPLKTAAQSFSLFKIVALPMRLSHDSFLWYQLEYSYFGLAVDQRDFTLLTEADLQQCTTSSVTICPAEVPFYHAQLLTCEGSLFCQSAQSYQLCRKNVLRHYHTPTLLHHGSKWAYHFPDPRQVNLRCPQDHGWSTCTVTLVGSGLIHNASTCHIAAPELRTLPVLSKTAEFHLDTPQMFLPDRIAPVESQELAKIEAAMSPETSGLDSVKERLATPSQSYDVDTLLHVHQQSVHAAQDSRWLRLVAIAACSVTVMVLLFFLLRARLHLLWTSCWRIETGPSPIAAPRDTTALDAMLEHGEVGTRSQDSQEPVAYSTYALRTD